MYIATAFDRGRTFASGRLVAALATLGVVLAGCSGSSKGGDSGYGTGDPKLAAPAPGGSAIDPFLSDGHAVLRALDAIAAKSGKPLRITSIDCRSHQRADRPRAGAQEPRQRRPVRHRSGRHDVWTDARQAGVAQRRTRHGGARHRAGVRPETDPMGAARTDRARGDREVELPRRARERVGVRRHRRPTAASTCISKRHAGVRRRS